jgi:RHS repeat-associated protein
MTPFSEQGERYDPESGLYHMNARDLDPNLGRFIQEDSNPAGQYADGPNLYQLEGSNPVIYTDPTGFKKMTCVATPTVAWDTKWTFSHYAPIPMGAGTKVGKAPLKADTGYMRAIYKKKFRRLYQCCDGCDSGPYWSWGPVQELEGFADAPTSSEFSAPIVKLPAGGGYWWAWPQGDLPNWAGRPTAPTTVNAMPPNEFPSGYEPVATLACKLPASKLAPTTPPPPPKF